MTNQLTLTGILLMFVKKINNESRRRKGKRRKRVIGDVSKNNNENNYGPNQNRFSNVILSPDRMFIKMRFNYLFTASSTVAVEYPYVGNSIYDPDPAIGGASADGFNQWMALYEYYRVHASDLKVNVNADYSGASPNYSNVRVITVPSTTATWTLSVNAAATSRFAKESHISWSGGGMCVLNNSITTCKVLGIRSNEGDMYSLSGTSSSNPTIKWYWHLLIQGMSTADLKVFTEIRITYHVELWKRKDTIELSEGPIHAVYDDGKLISFDKTPPVCSGFGQDTS